MYRTLGQAKTPSRLLNTLLDHFEVEKDIYLAHYLGVSQATITHFRVNNRPMGYPFLQRCSDILNKPLEEIFALAGIVQEKYIPPTTDPRDVKNLLRLKRLRKND